MHLNLFRRHLSCNCQDSYTSKTVPSISFNPSPALLQPSTLRRINYDRMITTYQHDFARLYEHFPIIDGNCIFINDPKISLTVTEQSNDDIECRFPLKLPYLHGHNIPGKKRQKLLFSELPKNENRHNINTIHINNHKKVHLLKDRKTTNLPLEVKANTHQNFSLTDEDYDNNRSNNIGIREGRKEESTNTITDSVKNGSHSKIVKKFTKNHKFVDVGLSLNKKTSEMIDNIPVPPWISEYQDTIGETAKKILKIQLHSHKRHKMINNRKSI